MQETFKYRMRSIYPHIKRMYKAFLTKHAQFRVFVIQVVKKVQVKCHRFVVALSWWLIKSKVRGYFRRNVFKSCSDGIFLFCFFQFTIVKS
jgi:hypothetical protein